VGRNGGKTGGREARNKIRPPSTTTKNHKKKKKKPKARLIISCYLQCGKLGKKDLGRGEKSPRKRVDEEPSS